MKTRICIVGILLLMAWRACGQAAQLSMSSQVQYSTVIVGAQDPLYTYIYNEAPTGSANGNFQVYATFPYGTSGTVSGSKIADGGTGYITIPFNFDTSQVTPASNVQVSATMVDTNTNYSMTQYGAVTVLAHASPELYLGGQPMPLASYNKPGAIPQPTQASSPNDLTVTVQTTNFGESSPGGTEMAASANPQMLGDPPDVPTAELDLDSISSAGSPYITTTLTTFTDMPPEDLADDEPFQINADVPGPGDYSSTFTLHYSDEQDLPGTDIPGAQVAYFTVDADVNPDTTTFTIEAPEPANALLVATVAVIGTLRRRRRH